MNEATWIEKMRAVEGTLYHVTCAMLREEYDRRDAMQETALRAWEKQSTLRKEEYFGTWGGAHLHQRVQGHPPEEQARYVH